LPKVDFTVKPNQVLVLKLSDYISDATFAVPTRIVQRDEEGEYIYVVTERDEVSTARKVYVSTGITSGNETEILEGLKGSELIVDKGFRELTEGVEVTVFTDSTSTVAKK
jgi:multidrug efflux pump subunit AcrA (membrane-fusion protein)